MAQARNLPGRRVRIATALICIPLLLPGGSVSAAPSVPDASAANPPDGGIVDGAYGNPYFGLRYPLPPGWQEGLEGPPPSPSGYYVLNAPDAEDKEHPSATLLISAQDMFFDVKPMATAAAAAQEMRESAGQIDGLKAEAPPSEVTLAGRSFSRVDIGGSVLSRVVLATDIRCHVVSFTFASPDRELLEKLVASLDGATLPKEASATGTGSGGADSPFPICMKDYASGENVLHKVEPTWIASRFPKIGVRIVIGTDGRVKHVHVIQADPEVKKDIQDAVVQWEFKPYAVDGHPVEVETGLLFERPKNPG